MLTDIGSESINRHETTNLNLDFQYDCG